MNTDERGCFGLLPKWNIPWTPRWLMMVRMRMHTKSVVVGLLLMFARLSQGDEAAWNRPFPPFQIADDLYYVGTAELASYLFTSKQGNILINPSYESTVPLIQASVEKLGFRFGETKIVLISHAHDDHAAGCARVKELTGAKLMVMDRDVAEIEGGGAGDFQYHNRWRPAKVDRRLRDGDQVKLGQITLTAHLTPGHTKGCTTWTSEVMMNGKPRQVVIVGSPNVNPGYRLVNNPGYAEIASDYKHTFSILSSLSGDVFLGAHGSYFGLREKYERWKAGDKSAFIDPDGYRAYVAERKSAFDAELKKQLKTSGSQ